MTKNVFITGITGQDGSYLAEYLYEQGYNVFGLVRRNSVPENQSTRIEHLVSQGKIHLYYGDLLDVKSIENSMRSCMPDEIYNLAAQSHVRISSDVPQFTLQVNSLGVLNMLEAYRTICPKARFYQASSSEMFGNSITEKNGSQNENTPMHPVSPYGCSKLYSYHIVRHYRKAYGLFACNGILFNHESPRRASNFVSNKIIKTAVQIKKGLKDKLELGNLDTFRDWGHSKDYVRAMHLIVNHDIPDDFVVSTGETHSIRELCDHVFTRLGMNYKDYVIQNPKFMRAQELQYLKGNCSKVKKTLGWTREYSFEELLDDMIEHWVKIYK